MKTALAFAVSVAVLLATNLLHAQLQFSSDDLAAIESTTPLSAVPAVGTFYSAANPQNPPAPANVLGWPAWDLGNIGGIEFYLLDDLDVSYSGGGFHAMDDSDIPPGGGDGDSGFYEFTNTYSFPTNGLWLQITNLADGAVFANLNGGTDYVYEIFSTTNLAPPMAISNWNIETEVFPENNTNSMPFTVPINGRNPLFLWARDWTGITNNGNVTPEWWFYYWFGTINLSDDDYNNQVWPLYDFYQDGLDPNVINFALSCTNQYVNVCAPSIQLDVTRGTPYYIAVLVDDPNQADATWVPYTSSNIVANIGSIQGWHNIYVGLRGLPSNATQTWGGIRLKLDLTPPLIVVTNPVTSVVTQPTLQLQGYSSESLASFSYDITNAAGLLTNQQVLVTGQYIDPNAIELTTNYFQCFDVPLTNGPNTITFRATDFAGNVTTTNFTFILDYSSATNPPVIQLNWPQNGTQISGNSFTWRGCVSEATAQVIAQVVNTNGVTNSVTGQVGRRGDFWVYNLPLSSGSNYLSLTATDVAGNTSSTNISVIQSPLVLTITSAALGQPVQGTISDWTNYTVWVNGVIATNNGDGTWTAYPNLNLDTPVVQVRAIPNSDNGGYGGGQ